MRLSGRVEYRGELQMGGGWCERSSGYVWGSVGTGSRGQGRLDVTLTRRQSSGTLTVAGGGDLRPVGGTGIPVTLGRET